MARRTRRPNDEPPAVRAARDRERHISQVTSYGFFARRGPKRSVTVTPAPLRYWQYVPSPPASRWPPWPRWRSGSWRWG